MVKISIIIPVYNGEDYIDKSYNSVLNQTIDDYEIIYIDDGSYDGSLKKLNHLQQTTDFVKVFSQKNSGSGNARNYGLKQATGEYISFLDVDDVYLDEDALETMYYFAKETDANMVCANLKRITTNGKIEENYNPASTRYAYFTEKETIKSQEYGIPWAFYKNIYKKSFLDKNQIVFPSLKVGEDPLFLTNVLVNTENIHVVNKDLYGYNHSAGGGLNLKIDNYDKKRDYIQQFIQVFDLLKINNFNRILDDYKLEFIDYLTFRENLLDEDIQKIISYFFRDSNYFTVNDYGYNIINLLSTPVKMTETMDNISLLNNCIFKEVIIENHHIDLYRLRKFVQLEQSIDKENLSKISTIQLKEVDIETFNSLRKELHQVGKFRKEIKRLIRYNDDILTSRSWKLTEFLRSIKHQYK